MVKYFCGLIILFGFTLPNPVSPDYNASNEFISQNSNSNLLKSTETVKTDEFTEEDGWLVMEAENTSSDYDLWVKKTDVPEYQGSGHLEFTGNKTTNGPPMSPLAYTFKITNAGTYRLIIRARKRLETDREDISNDGFLRMEGDFEAGPDPSKHATKEELTENQKFFGGNADNWGTAEKYDINNSHKFREAVYQFKAGETYTLYISGRSKNWNIDRLLFYDTDKYTIRDARNQIKTRSESSNPNISVPTVPRPPTGLNAQAASIDQIDVNWIHETNDESGFRLEVSQDGGETFSSLGELAANTTTYAHTGVSAGQEYCYRVTAFNDVGSSAASNIACATISIDAPNAPTNLKAEPSATSKIVLTWTDQIENEEGFYIERKDENGEFQRIGSVVANQASIIDNGLSPATTYVYRVQAFNQGGESPFSNQARATTFSEIIVSNQMSPNGDLINDTWSIENINDLTNYTIRVFTKGGEVVFESDNYTNEWDGRNMSGTLLQAGVYFYTISVGGTKNFKSGYITLIY